MAGDRFSAEQVRHLRAALLTWFNRHKRDLPWRHTRDPYAIWVSEIMLQQTRVAAVLDHYARWMERFPTLAALAAAEEQEVLALWSGLGYYRRARYLHAGARTVVAEHGGEVPRTAAALRELPGVGEYTSAAIASIAFGEPVAVVDGNVERVVMRLAGLAADLSAAESQESFERSSGQKAASEPKVRSLEAWPSGQSGAPRMLPAASLAREIRAVANLLLTPEHPGDSNQAMMELGATVCLPRAPLCLSCPVQPWCRTRGEHGSAPRKAMKSRTIDYALVTRIRGDEQEVLLVQRAADISLMAGMWELPEVPAGNDEREPLLTLRHAITVTSYTVRVRGCTRKEAQVLEGGPSRAWHPVMRLPATALTGLTRKVLKRLALWPDGVMVSRRTL